MINIGYNYQVFVYKYGGASRIFSEIAPLISQSDSFTVNVYAGLYQNEHLKENSSKLSIKGKYISFPPRTRKLFLSLNSVFAKAALAIDRPSIIHETYYSQIETAPKKSIVVVTVLDMIHEKFPDLMNRRDTASINKINTLTRADWIICISESTKQDLIEILNVDPKKISVIYLGNSFDSQMSIGIQRVPIVSDPYILYVGSRGSYKNFDRLLRAYGNNKQLKTEFKLVCFGDESFSRKEKSIMLDLGIDYSSMIHYTGSDSILANLYTHATALVYPSLYEGFGIPPLEAMSFNCPVVCSNTSSIPEVVDNAGEYFDPYDTDSISTAIERVVFSPSFSAEMVSRGQARAKLFSWEKCAQATMEVYKLLA
jgi:glycosyltransferase involved in cell wall biosynthesis